METPHASTVKVQACSRSGSPATKVQSWWMTSVKPVLNTSYELWRLYFSWWRWRWCSLPVGIQKRLKHSFADGVDNVGRGAGFQALKSGGRGDGTHVWLGWQWRLLWREVGSQQGRWHIAPNHDFCQEVGRFVSVGRAGTASRAAGGCRQPHLVKNGPCRRAVHEWCHDSRQSGSR